MKNILRKTYQTGDTIVEVLLSMAVLAIVASAAYGTSTRSFHAGVDAKEREQALSLAQGQVETIKNADANGTVDSLKNSSPPTTSGQYSIARSYSAASKSFTVTVSWTSLENRPQQVVLYYRPSNSYIP